MDRGGNRPSLIGHSLPRVEDDRLLSGRGEYVADVRLPRMVEVAFVRSQVAHARLVGVDLTDAREEPGVLTAVCARDLEGVEAVADFPDWAQPVATFPLCAERIRYVGQPIAAIVAADRYLAEDVAETVWPEIEPLPPVVSMEDALAPDAPRLYEDWPNNLVVDDFRDLPEVDEPFGRLHVVRGRYRIHRHGAVPLEPRGVVAEFKDGRLTVHLSQQLPHIARGMLAQVLGLPERSVRVVVGDVGGGFGGKAQIYPEDYVVSWLAMRLGRPVRWIEDRYEHLVGSCHSRDMRIDLEAAVHDDGRIEALRGTIVQDVGSGQIFPNAHSQAFVAAGALTGPYRIAHQNVRVQAVVTNKTPAGAYRGFGMPEAAFAMERMVDRIAMDLGLDANDLRRRMMITQAELPYITASGARIDSGSHHEAFERAVSLAERELAVERAAHEDDAAVRIGLGIATFVEGTAPSFFGTTGNWGSQDSADIRFDPGGGVTVAVGLAAYGQGVRTMVATVTAEELGLRPEDVRVVMGDTDVAPYGLGSFGSRSTVVAAGAIQRAAAPLREKGKAIAAHLLEAASEDVELGDGGFTVRGAPRASISWAEVARAALARTLDLPDEIGPGLSETATYDPPHIEHAPDARGKINGASTYTNATHAAIVAVNVRTGAIRVLRYIVVHDCGRVINPRIVAGQVIGGLVQGIGGALLEEFAYDESGSPRSTTFMEYLLPTASESPRVLLEELETPAPDTPLGAKGAGEGGIIGPSAVLARAVEHALCEFDVPHIASTPITPQRVLAWTSPEAA